LFNILEFDLIFGTQTGWTQKLERVGIDEDAGKAAIACARRLGIDIS
jgi:hypothetical protein